MSDPSTDPTIPPHQPNTLRTWLPRLWRFSVGWVAAHPDLALIAWLASLAVAVIL